MLSEIFKSVMPKKEAKLPIQSLWIGKELSTIEQLCIKSFLKNGFEFHLYTYAEIENIPEGTKVIDGRTIVPEELMFTYKNGSYAAFSNLFRYALLYKLGGIWVDMDTICLKPFKFKTDFVCTTSVSITNQQTNVSPMFIQAKPNSEAMKFAYEKVLALKPKVLSGEIEWGAGVTTLVETVEKYNLQKYALPWQTFMTCNWEYVESLIDPNFNTAKVPTKITDVPKQTVGIHLWNEIWRRRGLDKNKQYPKDSILESLKHKYL